MLLTTQVLSMRDMIFRTLQLHLTLRSFNLSQHNTPKKRRQRKVKPMQIFIRDQGNPTNMVQKYSNLYQGNLDQGDPTNIVQQLTFRK